MAISLAETLLVSLQALGVAVVVVLAGVALARWGVLNVHARKALAELSMKALIPALLFTKIIYCDQCHTEGKGTSWPKDCRHCKPLTSVIAEGWILLVFPFLVVILGLALGKVVSKVTRCPENFKGGCVAAVSFGNSTGIPIVLLTVVNRSLRMRQDSRLGQSDPLLYLSVYLLLYPVLQWSVGGMLLGIASSRGKREGSLVPLAARDTAPRDEQMSTTASSEAICPPSARPPLGRRFVQALREVLANALVPPVVAVLAGLVIGLVRPLRLLFVDIVIQNRNAFLQFLYDGLEMLGKAAVPVNLLILGAALAKGADWSSLPLTVGVAIVICKMVIMPGVVALLVYGLSHAIAVKDQSIWLVALVVSCTPTANNVAVMAELGGQSREAMATSIFLQWLVAPILLTTSISCFVALIGSGQLAPSSVPSSLVETPLFYA